jgi:uncharacterized protein YceK
MRKVIMSVVLCLFLAGCASTGSLISMTPDRIKAYQETVQKANATATTDAKVRGCIYEYFQGTSGLLGGKENLLFCVGDNTDALIPYVTK